MITCGECLRDRVTVLPFLPSSPAASCAVFSGIPILFGNRAPIDCIHTLSIILQLRSLCVHSMSHVCPRYRLLLYLRDQLQQPYETVERLFGAFSYTSTSFLFLISPGCANFYRGLFRFSTNLVCQKICNFLSIPSICLHMMQHKVWQ